MRVASLRQLHLLLAPLRQGQSVEFNPAEGSENIHFCLVLVSSRCVHNVTCHVKRSYTSGVAVLCWRLAYKTH